MKAKVLVNQWVDGSYHVFHPQEGKIPCNPIDKRSSETTQNGVRPAISGASGRSSSKKLKAGSRSESATSTYCPRGTLRPHHQWGDIFMLQ
ncbi:MAG: hypothetical protein JRI22_06365 [Deltaproteobacteria bacterium]|nr:hypothetical protein [Deltaproteobacteria bacterium]